MRSYIAVVLFGTMLATVGTAVGASDGLNERGDPPLNPPKTAEGAAKAPGMTWQSIAHLPDWTGVWEPDWRAARSGMPKLTPEYQAKLDQYRSDQKDGKHQQNNTANCDPPGMPQIMAQPYPVEFLFTPGKVTVVIEAYSQMRRIYIGRKHTEDPDPSYQGESIGHWEGDTLVVDTVGFIPNSVIMPGLGHTDDMRIEERIRRVTPDRLEIARTIFDPKVFAEPFKTNMVFKRHADWDIKEYICAQNNRDSADEEGRANMNLKR